jgi:hypothetical protein
LISIEDVVTFASSDEVVALIPIKDVVAGSTIEVVIPRFGIEYIAVVSAEKFLILGSAYLNSRYTEYGVFNRVRLV